MVVEAETLMIVRDDVAATAGATELTELAPFSATGVGEDRDSRAAPVVIRKP